MKTTIYYYHFQDFKEKTGYDHNEEIPVEDTFKVAQKINEEVGLNVMICNLSGGNKVLYVDDRNFKQR